MSSTEWQQRRSAETYTAFHEPFGLNTLVRLLARADSLSIHLVKRVVEGQWATGTTTADYLSDIRATVQAPSARILVTEADWGGSFAAAITPTTDVVPAGRRGPGAQRLLFVLYSANDAILKTAYMFSDLTTLRLSGKTVWLR